MSSPDTNLGKNGPDGQGITRRQLIKDLLLSPKVVEASITTPTTQQVPDNTKPNKIFDERLRAINDREAFPTSNLRVISDIAAVAVGISLIMSKDRPEQSIQSRASQLIELQRNEMPVYPDGVQRTIFEMPTAIPRSNEKQNRILSNESQPPRNLRENQRIGAERYPRPVQEARGRGISENPDARSPRERVYVYAEQGTVIPPEISYEHVDGMTLQEIKDAMESRKGKPQQK